MILYQDRKNKFVISKLKDNIKKYHISVFRNVMGTWLKIGFVEISITGPEYFEFYKYNKETFKTLVKLQKVLNKKKIVKSLMLSIHEDEERSKKEFAKFLTLCSYTEPKGKPRINHYKL